MVVNTDGSLKMWQPKKPGPVTIPLPGKATQAAATYSSAYVLLDDGTVMAWGSNDFDALGLTRDMLRKTSGGTGLESAVPIPIAGLSDIVQISAAFNHAVAVRRDGTVFAWGSKSNGLSGNVGAPSKTAPDPVTQVPGLTGIVQAVTATSHSLALGRDGRVYAWGANGHGQLGSGEHGPVRGPGQVPGLDHVVAIAAGMTTSLALKSDGSVWVWGSNQSSMFGNGERPGAADEPGGISPTPVLVKGVRNVRSLAAGEGHALALLSDGSMRAWGFDGYGQTGVGTSGGYQSSPVKIPTPTGVKSIYANSYRSFAVTADGTLWHWGSAIPPGNIDRDSRKRPVVFAP